MVVHYSLRLATVISPSLVASICDVFAGCILDAQKLTTSQSTIKGKDIEDSDEILADTMGA